MTAIEDLMPEDEFACKILKSSTRTAQRLRANRQSPPYIKLGKKVFYRKEAVSAWLLEQEKS